MRILHVSKYYHPFRGGIEKVIQELAEASVQEGHQVTVLCANHGKGPGEEWINGVKVVRLPTSLTLFSQPVSLGVFWELQRQVDSHDVVQLHTPNPLFELATMMSIKRKPLIVTHHCEVVRQSTLLSFYEPVSRSLLQRADRIVVATENHLKYSRWLHEYADKCEIIPFGIKAKYAEKNNEIEKACRKIEDQHGRFFLFVGRMVGYKGVNVLLKAMRQVEQNLVLVGQGPMLKRWEKMSNYIGVSHKVHFCGGLSNDTQFAGYLHSADALVLPSITEAEAFGLVLLEAMSCGTPIVTTKLKSGVRCVNQNHVTGLEVDPGDEKGLGEALSSIAKKDEMRLEMSLNARKRFEERFHVKRFFKDYEALYGYLLSHESRPSALPRVS